ncbi:MAG: hypothetical protein DRO73_09470 [Candidatus Thorarchaeota archaeon]|nr:MAG: hypothetical protein DRO73_09470 [Candidatus Thorarchaeota archaeon]
MCSVCGRPVCTDCVVEVEGRAVCVDCEWSMKSSSSGAGHADQHGLIAALFGGSSGMFQVGIAGCIVGILVVVFLATTGLEPPDGISMSMILSSPRLGILLGNLLAGLMIAVGFMGFYEKYRVPVFRIVALIVATTRAMEPLMFIFVTQLDLPGLHLSTMLYLGEEIVISDVLTIVFFFTRNRLASTELAVVGAMVFATASAMCTIALYTTTMGFSGMFSLMWFGALALSTAVLCSLFASERSAASAAVTTAVS